MYRLTVGLILSLAAVPAFAREPVDHAALRDRSLAVLETQFSAFSQATQALAEASIAYCDAGAPKDGVETAFRDAWLAWAPLDSYQFGPTELNGAALSVNFWPDKKNFVGRALGSLLKQPAEVQRDPETIAANSAAVQGLPAIEMLLFTDLPECPALVGVSAFLHQTAETLYRDWFDADGWADLVRAAGPENPVYLSTQEFTKTLFTAVDFGLIRVADQRLGRPLGTYTRSFPTRAEAYRSGLTTEIILAQMAGLAALVDQGFGPQVADDKRDRIETLFARLPDYADRIGMPINEAVKTPQTRIRVEALQSRVQEIQAYLDAEIGPELDVEIGFSAADGD